MSETKETEVPILSRLRPPAGAVRARMRVGRGVGSGKGKTAGKGQKGQKARQPGNIHKLHFEGGQMPLQRRFPKFGFTNIFAKTVAKVNVKDLGRFAKGANVDEGALRKVGLIKGKFDYIKVLGDGELKHAVNLKVHQVSASARAKIEKLGGKIDLIPTTVPRKTGREAKQTGGKA